MVQRQRVDAETATTWTTTYQVYLYDIGSGETSVLTDDAGGQPQPGHRRRPGGLADLDPLHHQGIQHLSGTTFDISHHGDTCREPEVDGTRVAWWGSKGLYYAVPAAEATRFPDVPTGHHYLTAIEGVASKGIMTGYGDGNFGPNDWLIHQQFAQMIDVAMGYPVTEEDLYDFTDQPPIVHLETSSTRITTWRSPPSTAWSSPTRTARSGPSTGSGATRPWPRRWQRQASSRAARRTTTPGRIDRPGRRRRRDPARGRVQRPARQHRRAPTGPWRAGTPTPPPRGRETAQLLWNLYLKVHPAN